MDDSKSAEKLGQHFSGGKLIAGAQGKHSSSYVSCNVKCLHREVREACESTIQRRIICSFMAFPEIENDYHDWRSTSTREEELKSRFKAWSSTRDSLLESSRVLKELLYFLQVDSKMMGSSREEIQQAPGMAQPSHYRR